MSEINITEQNFEEEVLKSDKPVLIDFWAPWCGPCGMLAPVIEEIAENHPEIKVCKVNIDEQMDLATSYRVASIPTVVLIKDGNVVNKLVGFHPGEEIEELLEEI